MFRWLRRDRRGTLLVPAVCVLLTLPSAEAALVLHWGSLVPASPSDSLARSSPDGCLPCHSHRRLSQRSLRHTSNKQQMLEGFVFLQPENFVYLEAWPGVLVWGVGWGGRGALGLPGAACLEAGMGAMWQVFLGRLPLRGLLDTSALPPRPLQVTLSPVPPPPCPPAQGPSGRPQTKDWAACVGSVFMQMQPATSRGPASPSPLYQAVWSLGPFSRRCWWTFEIFSRYLKYVALEEQHKKHPHRHFQGCTPHLPAVLRSRN